MERTYVKGSIRFRHDLSNDELHLFNSVMGELKKAAELGSEEAFPITGGWLISGWVSDNDYTNFCLGLMSLSNYVEPARFTADHHYGRSTFWVGTADQVREARLLRLAEKLRRIADGHDGEFAAPPAALDVVAAAAKSIGFPVPAMEKIACSTGARYTVISRLAKE